MFVRDSTGSRILRGRKLGLTISSMNVKAQCGSFGDDLDHVEFVPESFLTFARKIPDDWPERNDKNQGQLSIGSSIGQTLSPSML